ncbi:MAG: hypothetical protein HN726_00290, partial [Candidatus Magasanikbacteria bacterium]|nr:hypothetical protein [Candidatus Magasanikbacteria bacterium]
MSTPKGKTKIMLLAMSSIFFVTYLFLYIGGVPLVGDKALPYLIFNQPDESINYAFIREYVLEGNRQIQEPLLDLTENQVHPRSTTVVNGALTPIGFPGVIILFGAIVKGLTAISGLEFFNIILLTLTPLCAVIAPWFLYGVIRRIWGEHIGIMSAILVYILPGWWYYASRPLQHTILFVTLLLIGSYAALKMKEAVKETKQITWGLLAGLGISLALFVRPSEVLWVSAIALGFLLIHKKDVTKHVIRGGILGIILIALLFFFGQLSYYGHVFGTGYAPPTSIGSAGQITEGLFGNDSIIK